MGGEGRGTGGCGGTYQVLRFVSFLGSLRRHPTRKKAAMRRLDSFVFFPLELTEGRVKRGSVLLQALQLG